MFKRFGRVLGLSLMAAVVASGCGQTPSSAPRLKNAHPAAAPIEDTLAPPAGAEPDEPTVRVIPGGFVADQLIVAVQPGHRAVLAAPGFTAKTLKQWDMGLRYQLVQIPAGMTREEATARLQRQPGVAMVGPNRRYSVSMTPNDSRFSEQWGLKADRANAVGAWDKGVNGSGVTVAVLDTGVDYNHPELAGRVILGPNLADNNSDPMDVHGHGTHCSGIIAAAGNNAQGVAGVAWNAKILAIKVLGNNGGGSTDTVAEGIKYAVDHGARVINLSLGAKDPSIDAFLHAALKYAWDNNVVTVAAAGNNHGPVGSPACDPFAIAVSSTSSFWKFEWPSLFSNYGEKVDVAAPGGGILSTLPSNGGSMGKMYGKLSGTSMAAPFVAGEAALIISQHPTWSAGQVRERIRSAVDDKGAKGKDDKYGYGRINLARAID